MSDDDNGDGPDDLDPGSISKLTRDLAIAAISMGKDEARFLVDSYYVMQDNRIRSAHQLRQCEDIGEPALVLAWMKENSRVLENQVKRALDKYSGNQEIGIWARSIIGVGPVIAAGLISNIDPHKAATAGAIWRFAGLDPSVKWGKGKKRPWNASLKRLCWLLGESFVKVSNKENSMYGKVYKEHKAMQAARNMAGEHAQQALQALQDKKIDPKTDAYKWYSGTWVHDEKLHIHNDGDGTLRPMLPPAQIHERAKRYAVKLFLSHLHQVWRKMENLPCPEPYVIAHMGHTHKIEPPNQP